MIGRAAKGGWIFLAVVMALAVWVYSTGQVYLYGFGSQVMEHLAQAANLIPSETYPRLYSFFTILPMDSALTASLFQSVLALSAFSALWLTLRRVWDNPVSPTLTCGLLFFGAMTGWFRIDSPEAALTLLFKAGAVATLVAGKVPLLAGCVLVLGYSDPAFGIAMYLALAYLAYLRQKSYGNFVSVLAVVGTGSLLAVLVGSYTLTPSTIGLSLWSAVPLLSLLLVRELRKERAGIYLTLLSGSVVTGSPEVASAICFGDLALLGLQVKGESEEAEDLPQDLSLSLKNLTQTVALFILILGVVPGEQRLNRYILVPSQKKKVPLSRLFVPFSLTHHGQNLDQLWRGKTPFPGLSQNGLILLQKGDGPFRVLTPDESYEDRTLALAYALLSNRPLRGWISADSLSGSSLTCRHLKKNVLLEDDEILFRENGTERLESGPQAPENPQELPPLQLDSVWSLPIRHQNVSEKPGTGYILKTLKTTEKLFFPDTPAVVTFAAAPEIYRVGSLNDKKKFRDFRINSIALKLIPPSLELPVPSRSLVPLAFSLTNQGENPITSEELKSITLGLGSGSDFPAPSQSFPKKFVLFPGETINLPLTLVTPTAEGTFRLQASITTVRGQTFPVPVSGDGVITTWRRLAPTGHWVEEPARP
ncbi:MAG TPA: hypothetical protein EYO33_14105 [Phycisphaerales bacterium]|nr:hypothetical protein [Phycisphaerales bacterium]